MRIVLLLLAVLGFLAAALALREHYRTEGDAPCSINDRWDCGIVNKSPFAVVGGIPVAAIGMVGYVLLGALALMRSYRLMLATVALALGYSLYLAHIEKDILGVWCVYCVASLSIISLMTLLVLATVLVEWLRPHLGEPSSF
jgi:vitamin-K-epoxide reductase (warfarin-sensitive)